MLEFIFDFLISIVIQDERIHYKIIENGYFRIVRGIGVLTLIFILLSLWLIRHQDITLQIIHIITLLALWSLIFIPIFRSYSKIKNK